MEHNKVKSQLEYKYYNLRRRPNTSKSGQPSHNSKIIFVQLTWQPTFLQFVLLCAIGFADCEVWFVCLGGGWAEQIARWKSGHGPSSPESEVEKARDFGGVSRFCYQMPYWYPIS